MRKPSPATELRQLKRAFKEVGLALVSAKATAEQYRVRATKAEQEAKEWKQRFDTLLANIPAAQPVQAIGKMA